MTRPLPIVDGEFVGTAAASLVTGHVGLQRALDSPRGTPCSWPSTTSLASRRPCGKLAG
jgi:hypothetical protein